MANPIVVFDLDGTLVDTAPDLVSTLNVVFSREGLSPIPFADARNMIGGGVRRMIERGLQSENRSCTPQDIDRMFNGFIEYYAAHIADASRPFPGLESALDALAGRGFQLAVCTNKLEQLSIKLLNALDLAARFAAICGQDTFGVQKPDPEILLRTISRVAGSPRLAVMVGDSSMDVDTARAALVPVIAVDFGYTEIPAAQLGADRVISRFEDLPAVVFDLFAKAGTGSARHARL